MTPLTALVVSACVDDEPPVATTGDDAAAQSDGSAVDAVANGDGAVVGDGSIPIDASIPCDGTWCTCGTAATSAFCDDFDRPGEHLAETWSYDASFASNDGGIVKLSAADAESPPRSMHATVIASPLAPITAALTENIGAKTSTIAFDLLLDGAGANCSGTTIDFARLGIGTSVTPSPIASVRFSVLDGVPQLGLFDTGQTRINGDASLPSRWTRIRMTAKLGVIDGGANGVTANVYVTPAGSDDAVDASVLLSGSIPITTGTTSTWVSIGVLNSENSAPCGVYIDNVAIYQ